MKKKISLLLTGILLTVSSINVFGADGMFIDSKPYVPVRDTFNELGFGVDYDNGIATAVVTDDNYKIRIPKNKNYFMVNDKGVKPDNPQKIVNERMYIPYNAVGIAIAAETNYDKDNDTAYVKYDDKNSYINYNTAQANTQVPQQQTNDDFENSDVYKQISSILTSTISQTGAEANISYNKEHRCIETKIYTADLPSSLASASMTDHNSAVFKNSKARWDAFTESTIEVSNTIYLKVKQAGYDVNCEVTAVSKENSDKVLYKALNGKEVYNSYNDKVSQQVPSEPTTDNTSQTQVAPQPAESLQKISSIALSESSLNMKVGDSHEIIAAISPSSSDENFSLHSTDDNVARIKDLGNGKFSISAVDKGNAEIYAETLDGSVKSNTCTVTVGNSENAAEGEYSETGTSVSDSSPKVENCTVSDYSVDRNDYVQFTIYTNSAATKIKIENDFNADTKELTSFTSSGDSKVFESKIKMTKSGKREFTIYAGNSKGYTSESQVIAIDVDKDAFEDTSKNTEEEGHEEEKRKEEERREEEVKRKEEERREEEVKRKEREIEAAIIQAQQEAERRRREAELQRQLRDITNRVKEETFWEHIR